MPDLVFMNQNEQEAACVCVCVCIGWKTEKYIPASFLQSGDERRQKPKHIEKLHTAKASMKGSDKWLA